MAINPISPTSINSLAGLKIEPKLQSPQGNTTPLQEIGQTFEQALDAVNSSAIDSDNLIQQLAAGEDVDIHQVMIASEQTDVNFRIALAIRDRLVDAYRETMRMSV